VRRIAAPFHQDIALSSSRVTLPPAQLWELVRLASQYTPDSDHRRSHPGTLDLPSALGLTRLAFFPPEGVVPVELFLNELPHAATETTSASMAG
jgi:hypothetical protein